MANTLIFDYDANDSVLPDHRIWNTKISDEMRKTAMTESRGISGVIFGLLVLCASLANAALTTEASSNVVLQWGNAKALGVGPYAVGDYPIPITPSGVYEELVNGLPVIPLNASSYLHASNGAMYMVITTDTTGPERLNRFFVAGMTASGLNISYPTPVEVTSLMGCTIAGNCLATGAQIVDFEILDEMLAFLVVWPSSPNVAEAITMAFMNSSVSNFPIGRDESSGPLSKPGVVSSLPFTTIANLELACGQSYCIATNRSYTAVWSVPSSALASITNTTVANSLLIPLAHSFMLASSKYFFAYGTNDHQLFGSCNQLVCPSFQCQNGNVVDASCSESHCLAMCGNKVYAWGDNRSNQTLGTTAFTPFASATILTIPGSLAPASVGTAGCASYVLTTEGSLFAFGCNMVEFADSVTYREANLYGDAWLGFASQYRVESYSAKVVPIPAYYDLSGAPKLSTMSNFGKAPRAMHLPAKISLANFNKLASTKVGLSSLDKVYSADAPGLITWGAGYNTHYGIPFANRSTNAAAIYAGVPQIAEISNLAGTILGVSANQKSALFHTSAASVNLYAWGRFQEEDAVYGPAYNTDTTKLSSSVSNPVKLANYPALTAGKFFGSCSAQQFSCTAWSFFPKTVLSCWGNALEPNMTARRTYTPYSYPIMLQLSDTIDMKCGQHFCSMQVLSHANDLYVWSLPSTQSYSHPDHPWLGLGSSPTGDLVTPQSVSMGLSPGENIQSFSHGLLFTVVATNYNVYAFGLNGATILDTAEVWGVLGTSNGSVVYSVPTIIFSQSLSIVAAGRGHVIGFNAGVVYSWGLNNFGQLGRTTNQPWQIGTIASLPGTVTNVAAVSYTSYAILNDGSVFAWGVNGATRMFGDPLLSHLGHSEVPLAVGLNRALGLNFKVTNIHSSSFLNTVLATGTFGTGAAPSNPPALNDRLNSFGVSKDQICGYTSATAPGSVFRNNEELLPQFEVDEVIVGAEKSLHYGVLWTNYSRVYASGGLSVRVLSNASSPWSPNPNACSPTMIYESATPISKATLHNSGVVIHFTDGSVKIAHFASDPSDYTSLPENYLNVDCVPETCALEKSDHSLTFVDTGFNTVPSLENFVTVSGPYAISSSNTLVAVLNFQINFHNMSDLTTRVVTGEFPMLTAQVRKLVGSHDHFLALGTDGLIYGFGNQRFGKLPFDCSNSFKSIFAAELGNAQIADIAATSYTSFAISAIGEVYAWGFIPSEGPNLNGPVTTDMFANSYHALHTYLLPTKLRIPPATGVSGTKFIVDGMDEMDEAKQESVTHWSWSSKMTASIPPISIIPPAPISIPPISLPPVSTPISLPPMSLPPISTPISLPPISTPPVSTPPVSIPPSVQPPTPISFPPSSINLPPLEPPGPACPTPPSAGNWACDPATGTLYLAGSLQMSPDAPLSLEGPIVIVGDFTIPPGASLSIQLKPDIFSSTASSSGQKRFVNEAFGTTPSPASNEPMVTVSGCAAIDEPISLKPDEKAVKEIKKGGEKGKTINIVKSSCTQTPGKLLVEGAPDSQKGCRRYTAQQQETKGNDGTVTLSAIMVINHDSCNHWWIILVCVLAVLAVFAVIAVVILKVPALRNKLLPYRDAKF